MEKTTRRYGTPPPIPGLAAWTWLVFLVVLAAELICAYYVVYKDGRVMTDALARTANAYYVLYILPSKLASMGFVWNPLPSLLQLPILAFNKWWPPLASCGFAGCIVTAIFAGINAAALFRYFRIAGSSIWFSLLVVFLYAFNPFIFYYGFNGMSESIFFTVLIVGIYNLAKWTGDRANSRLLVIGLMLAMGFLTRYETMVLVVTFGFSLVVAIYLIEDIPSPFKPKPAQMKRNYGLATFFVTFLPVIYTVCIWMIVCWIIMGDPFFFYRSPYSNESLTKIVLGTYASRYFHDPVMALIYVAIRALPFIIPVLVIICERVASGRVFKYDMLIFLVLTCSLTAFHYLLLKSGSSLGLLRYFCYTLPAGMAWIPFELPQLKKLARALTSVALCAGLLLSALVMPRYLSNPELAYEEATLIHKAHSGDFVPQVEMAKIINEKYSHAKILLDSVSAFSLIVNLDHPENLVTTTSENFAHAMKNPQDNGIDYIVATIPKGMGNFDVINISYPHLFHYGVPDWVDLVESNPWVRLYKVLPMTNAPSESVAKN